MHVPPNSREKVTINTLQAKKEHREVITMLTAYDYPTAQALDRADVDAILVGDSLGMVVLGYRNTLSVTMEDMLHHCKAVSRGVRRCHLVGDMPFMSYQVSTPEAVRNAGRFLQEAGMDAVKLEGGREVAASIEATVTAGIPVMGHLPGDVGRGGTPAFGRCSDSRTRGLLCRRPGGDPRTGGRAYFQAPQYPYHRYRGGSAL